MDVDPTGSAPGQKKRIMGGKPDLPKVQGRPIDPATIPPELTGEAPEGEAQDGQETGAYGGQDGPVRDGQAPVQRPRPRQGASPVDEAVQQGWTEVVQGVPVTPQSEVPAETLHFSHACCRAVRPNPEDPDQGGAVQEVRQEPYLTWQGALKPTATFGIALGVVGGLFLAAVILALVELFWPMVVLVSLASVLIVFLVAWYFVAASAMRNIDIRAVRHVIEPKIERGKLFHATLDTAGTQIPGLLKVTIQDQHAPGLRPVERPALDGAGRIHYRVRPQGRGLISFSGLEVHATDALGLWTGEQEWRLRTTIEVDASLPAIAWKARVTGYAPFDNSIPQSIVKLYREIEYEETRAFGSGDRMKDIMWKRMAIDGQMIVRKRSSEPDTTLLLVIDAGKSMLQDQAGFRNLDLGVEIAQEFAEAALKRNHETGMIAFNEERILDHVRPTRSKIQFKKLVLHLQMIADHHLPSEDDDPVMKKIVIAGDPENLRLGFGYGLRQRSTAAMTMIVFSDLQTTPEEIVQSLSKAAGSGQRVCVMLLPGPKLKAATTGERDIDAEEMELRGEAHTNRMRELLIANGCEFIEVNPTEDDFKLDVPMPDDKAMAQAAKRAQAAAAKAAAKPGAPKATPTAPKPVAAKPAASPARPASPGPPKK
jgi:uncharacterized protein (DUF58 family)